MTVPARSFTSPQLEIIKKTCAPKTNNDEFNYFISVAQSLGLNPLRRQILANVYSANDPNKRNVVIIVEIGGLRAIAARSGAYRPDTDDPEYVYREELRGPNNPHGIEKCSVSAFKQDSRGEWHRVKGTVYWDEFVQTNKDYKTGGIKLADAWKRMGRHMIAKCAEAHALRKGWPEETSGLYEFAEADSFDADMLPTEAIEQREAEERARRIGKIQGEYVVQWEMNKPLDYIAPGKFYDRVAEWVSKQDTVMNLRLFETQNELTLKRFWSDDKNGALELKRLFEKAKAAIESEEIIA